MIVRFLNTILDYENLPFLLYHLEMRQTKTFYKRSLCVILVFQDTFMKLLMPHCSCKSSINKFHRHSWPMYHLNMNLPSLVLLLQIFLFILEDLNLWLLDGAVSFINANYRINIISYLVACRH